MTLTISVNINSSTGCQQKFHDLKGTRFCTVMQGRVSFDRLPVDVGLLFHKVLGDFVVALVAGDHQAGVPMTVGHFNVWKIKQVWNKLKPFKLYML